MPVYRGNVIKPAEAGREPEVSWTSPSPGDDLWCLVMTGLDTHLTQVTSQNMILIEEKIAKRTGIGVLSCGCSFFENLIYCNF